MELEFFGLVADPAKRNAPLIAEILTQGRCMWSKILEIPI
jgi:hypothetical protein